MNPTATPNHGTIDIYPDAVFIDGHRINVDRADVSGLVVGLVSIQLTLTADTITLHAAVAPVEVMPEPIDF